MKVFSRIALPAAVAAALAIATPAIADDRDEPAFEAGSPGYSDVVEALHSMGVVSWDEIEWDDDHWEVDDAIRADGRQFDLKLDPQTLAVVHVEYEGRRRR